MTAWSFVVDEGSDLLASVGLASAGPKFSGEGFRAAVIRLVMGSDSAMDENIDK